MNTANFTRMALVIALRKMLVTGDHFCICSFDNCLKLAGISISQDERAPFHALHCVHYADMPTAFKVELAEQISAIFSRAPDFKFDVAEILSPPNKEESAKPSGLLKLLNWTK